MKHLKIFAVLLLLFIGTPSQAFGLGSGYTTDGCSLTQEVPAIHEAFGHLLSLMSAGYGNLVNCVYRAPLVKNNGVCGSNITSLMRNHEITNIKCRNLSVKVNAKASIDIDDQELTLDHGFLANNMANPRRIAAVIAHELMHNYGFTHPDIDSGYKYYSQTVPEQVERCVQTCTAAAAGTSNPWPDPQPHTNSCEYGVFAPWMKVSSSISKRTDLLIGNFNGDGKSDVLWADGTQWRIKYRATGRWEKVSESSSPASELRVGDYNGDGKSDILWVDGKQWRIKYGAVGSWNKISDSSAPVGELLIGDFNGDGKSDILWVDGKQWRIKYGAVGSWNKVSDSSALASVLVIGNFNGDAKSDVLWADGTQWRIKYGAVGSWDKVSDSRLRPSEFIVGDFNNDRLTDILYSTGEKWEVKYSARGVWKTISSSAEPVRELLVGDFNGDGGSDILRADGTGWRVRFALAKEATTQ